MANVNNSEPSEFVSTREAAERLGVAVRTVQLWVEAGVLRAWKTAGGHRRIARESLDALLASRAGTLAPAAPALGRQGPLRVMVVEDDPALQMLFEMTIGGWDFPVEVEVADNGFSALLKMGERPPDVLITDLNMPGMDGFSMIRHLRQTPQWQALPIIVVSALAGRDIEARGGLPPDVQVFGKPVPFATLEQLIRAEADRAASAGGGRD